MPFGPALPLRLSDGIPKMKLNTGTSRPARREPDAQIASRVRLYSGRGAPKAAIWVARGRKASVECVFIRCSSTFVFHRYHKFIANGSIKGANLCDYLFDRFRVRLCAPTIRVRQSWRPLPSIFVMTIRRADLNDGIVDPSFAVSRSHVQRAALRGSSKINSRLDRTPSGRLATRTTVG